MAETAGSGSTDPGNPAADSEPNPPCWSCFRRQFAVANAVLICLLSLAALIGWHSHHPELFQISRDFAPMQYNTALCFFGCGLSLLLTILGLRRSSALLAIGTLAITIPTLYQHLFNANLGIDQFFFKSYVTTKSPSPGRMALFTNASFILSAIALISSSLNTKGRNTSPATATVAAIIISISALGLIGYGFGLNGAFSWEKIAQMSLPTVCAFMALGIGLLGIAWRDCIHSTGRPPGWLPVSVLVISLTATFLLGTAISAQEERSLRNFIRDNAMVIRTALESEIIDRHHSLRRMAKRATENPNLLQERWLADAKQYLADDIGYEYIARTNEALEFEWVSPNTLSPEPGTPIGLGSEWTRDALIAKFDQCGGVMLVPLNSGDHSIALIARIGKPGELKGCLVASIDTQAFFNHLLPPDLADGYQFTISTGGKVRYARDNIFHPEDPRWAQSEEIDIMGSSWNIQIWPSTSTLAAENIGYSNVVLLMGVVLSILLGSSGYLFQVASTKSAEAAERNIQLQKEISERIRSQKQLEQLSALNNAIVTHSAYSVITTDTTGIITSFNPAAERMLGYKASEVIGKHSPAIIHDLGEIAARASKLSQRFNETIEPGFEVFVAETKRGLESQHEWTYIRRDGKRFPVTLGVSSLTNQQGNIIGYLGVASDISELKNTMKELKDTHEKLMSASLQIGRAEIATNILHNVGNVLNSINVSSTLLTDKVRNSRVSSVARVAELLASQQHQLADFFSNDRRGSELPEYLNKLSVQLSSEQQEILNDLSELARNINHIKEIVSVQQNYSKVTDIKERITVQELIDLSIKMHAGALSKSQIRLTIDCDPSLTVAVPKHKVLQILVNLVSNSKHACLAANPSDPWIHIKADTFGNTCRIVVEDNGEGIPKENLTRIFNHGFTTKKDGHGFGLHSCALAAKEMGGSLEAHSEGPGKGAAFTFTFPIH